MIDENNLLEQVEEILKKNLYVDPDGYIDKYYMNNTEEAAKEIIYQLYTSVINILESSSEQEFYTEYNYTKDGYFVEEQSSNYDDIINYLKRKIERDFSR